MNAWLIDAYRVENDIVVWLKNGHDDCRLNFPFSMEIYLEGTAEARAFLINNKIPFSEQKRKTYQNKWIPTFAVPVPEIKSFPRFVSWIERETKHRIRLFDADIAPEQLFLIKNHLKPFGCVDWDGERIHPLENEDTLPLSHMNLEITTKGDPRNNGILTGIRIDHSIHQGEEEKLLQLLATTLQTRDPDVIRCKRAFVILPYLATKCKQYGIKSHFHRWDETPLQYKGGKSFFSYGSIVFKDFPVRLHGRLLVDTCTAVGAHCTIDGIIELCQLSGCRFQQVASRSFGHVFQQALVRLMMNEHILVPYKDKPVDKPISMLDLVKADRVGHTYDPKVGFHNDVAEIDFASMYPWIIFNHNISADTMLDATEHTTEVPLLPLTISHKYKGLIPRALKPFIDRRMYYKQHPTTINRERMAGLKWVLVSCYGYLRFREFKLGVATSHMAIGGYAREIILSVGRMAEEQGFEIVHGIIDALYLKKQGLTDGDMQRFCDAVHLRTGIPISYEGIFKWVVFLSSINDPKRPLPSRYYGVFRNGDLKVRGVELRQRNPPEIVKIFQQKVLEHMAQCSTRNEIQRLIPSFCRMLRELLKNFATIPQDLLRFHVHVSKSKYTTNIPQKLIIEELKKESIAVVPGQQLEYMFSKTGATGLRNQPPDIEKYKTVLVRSLYILLQPFGVSRQQLEEMIGEERQAELVEFTL